MVHGVERIYAVWSSLEVIAKQEPQIFHQVLMEQIQVCLVFCIEKKNFHLTIMHCFFFFF